MEDNGKWKEIDLMNSNEFLYWLRGAFEMKSDEDFELSRDNATMIADHIRLVKSEGQYLSPFVIAIDSALRILDITEWGFVLCASNGNKIKKKEQGRILGFLLFSIETLIKEEFNKALTKKTASSGELTLPSFGTHWDLTTGTWAKPPAAPYTVQLGHPELISDPTGIVPFKEVIIPSVWVGNPDLTSTLIGDMGTTNVPRTDSSIYLRPPGSC